MSLQKKHSLREKFRWAQLLPAEEQLFRKGVMNASNRGIQQRTLKFWHFGELRKYWGAGVLKGACCM